MTATAPRSSSVDWPTLSLSKWDDTRATLYLWTQILGKVRLAQAPLTTHCGLTTSPMPYGGRSFQIDLDFIHHQLRIETSRGERHQFALRPCSVAEFYSEVMGRLRALGLEVRIWTMPVELESCSAVRGGPCACLL